MLTAVAEWCLYVSLHALMRLIVISHLIVTNNDILVKFGGNVTGSFLNKLIGLYHLLKTAANW